MGSAERVLVLGAKGMVGAAIVRALQRAGQHEILTPSHAELDLTDARATANYFAAHAPSRVFVAAAKVGGILANDTYPADFLYQNLMIEANVIHEAFRHNVKKLLFLGSTCIYPRMAPQPLKEDYLLTGPLEPTNEWYAIAKIAGIKLCEAYRKQHGCDFISAMPTNLYGPEDSFDLKTSHVLPALIRKFHEAQQSGASNVTLWGSGTPLREFLHVDDCASACLFLMDNYSDAQTVNIGTGEDLPIIDLARIIANVVGYNGGVQFDATKPDGTPRKLVDVTKLRLLGWQHSIALEDGIRSTYDWYQRSLQ
jgi:GDP-L-fucose synthase